jgi:RNA polymerase sigma-70 factor, ECF subfamily
MKVTHTEIMTDEARDDEARLVERMRAGEEQAFDTLVRRHGGAMLACARRFLGNDEECHDAVQDSFLSAFRALNSFQGNARLGTWLHRIVVNHCLMRLRSRKRRPTVAIDELLPTFDESGHHARRVVPWTAKAEDNVMAGETREQVRACISRLPDPYRTVILLRDIEGYDTQETAELLGISRESAKIRLHRARQALRTLLAPIFA